MAAAALPIAVIDPHRALGHTSLYLKLLLLLHVIETLVYIDYSSFSYELLLLSCIYYFDC